MQSKFQHHIEQHFSFLKNKKILLTISGGIDSVVLAYLSVNCHLDIALAHCNFHLRGKESEGDQHFVEALAEQLALPLYVEHFDTLKYAKKHQLSVQLAARKLRYDWFEELCQSLGYAYIFTAHHANDSLETYLINTIRGTGIEGLTGIPQQNGNIIRPLLPFSRKNIQAYAHTHGISWREDSSNAATKYLRNKIRHTIVPVFEKENPGLLSSFLQTQANLQDSLALLSEYHTVLWNEIVDDRANGLYFSIAKIQAKSNPRAVLYQLLYRYGFTAWTDILALLTAQSGKMVFSTTHRLVKDREELILTPLKKETKMESIKIPGEGSYTFPNGKIQISEVIGFKKTNNYVIYAAESSVQFPLVLRKWNESDFFYPFGMKGRKKVSRYLKDEKFSLVEKEETWVLLSDEKIVWVVGHRFDDRFKASGQDVKMLKIEWQT